MTVKTQTLMKFTHAVNMNKDNFTQIIKQELFNKKKIKSRNHEFIRGFVFANYIENEFITLNITSKDTLSKLLICLPTEHPAIKCNKTQNIN